MSDTPDKEKETTAESLLEDLGIVDPFAGDTPERNFYNYLTGEKHPKLYNCEYWLRHQLAVYTYLQDEKHLLTTKAAGATRIKVSMQELCRALLEYYFQMFHLARFMRTDGRPACDMDKVLDLVMAHESIKKYLHKSY